MTTLSPCPGCARHVRLGEARCPFCHAAMATEAPPGGRRAPRRLGRAALAAAGVTFAFTSACGGPNPGGSTVALYGGPPDEPAPRGQVEAESSEDAGDGQGEQGDPSDQGDQGEGSVSEGVDAPPVETVAPAYGAPPPFAED